MYSVFLIVAVAGAVFLVLAFLLKKTEQAEPVPFEPSEETEV